MPRRILIVQGDPQIARDLFEVFHFEKGPYEAERYDPHMAGSVAEAIELAQNIKFDCVVIDTVLPDADVCDAIPLMRTINSDPAIIVSTGHSDLELEARVREQDVYYYHVRSFGTERLRLAVRSVFEKLQKTRPGEQTRSRAGTRVLLKQMQKFVRKGPEGNVPD